MGILDSQENVTYNGRTSEVIVRQKTGRRIKGPFSAIGPITNKKRKGYVVKEDVFDLLDKVSKGAFSVFNNLKFNRSEDDNLTQYIEEEQMTRTQKETLSRKLKELRAVGLIRPVRGQIKDRDGIRSFTVPKGTFIINPDMIRCNNHDDAENVWNQCPTK